ncbi:hypothetical protein OED52_08620 [Rhodococcus sp. Z13]|uniref:Uncharacterized protein n=1 Tax=Rhodococcus sacchari TaxID=2962047 RepID=A0ACD4DLY8_9NOCA|nr:hypothetical protein [Rhodococcus sp. Z13]UYP20973.1 hypothetical protein OED52_08620 [Rhodococcus sp. Z13]
MTADRSPASHRRLSRRTLLRWSSVAVGGLGLATTTACGASDDDADRADPLEPQIARARTDAATATALVALLPDSAAALTTIAEQRTAHADVLEAEVARMRGATTSFTPSSTTPALPSGDPPTLEQLRERLARSQREAADLARILSGYRAGVLASISAACAVQTEVLL